MTFSVSVEPDHVPTFEFTLKAGVLDHLQYLRTLRLSRPQQSQDFNFPRLLQGNYAIERIYVECHEDCTPFGDEMGGEFPPKMSDVTLIGRGFKVLSNRLLEVSFSATGKI